MNESSDYTAVSKNLENGGRTIEHQYMYSYNCMNCAHPACVFRGESDHHYCGNYVSERRRTVEKIKVYVSNSHYDNCNTCTDCNDSASDT